MPPPLTILAGLEENLLAAAAKFAAELSQSPLLEIDAADAGPVYDHERLVRLHLVARQLSSLGSCASETCAEEEGAPIPAALCVAAACNAAVDVFGAALNTSLAEAAAGFVPLMAQAGARLAAAEEAQADTAAGQLGSQALLAGLQACFEFGSAYAVLAQDGLVSPIARPPEEAKHGIAAAQQLPALLAEAAQGYADSAGPSCIVPRPNRAPFMSTARA